MCAQLRRQKLLFFTSSMIEYLQDTQQPLALEPPSQPDLNKVQLVVLFQKLTLIDSPLSEQNLVKIPKRIFEI